MASFRDFVGKILVASKRRGTLLASFGSEGSLSMATTVADINCVESGTVDIYHKKVHELTCLISRSMPYLHRMALRRMGNVADAADVVQEALLPAYSHVEQFRGLARMSTSLTPTLINSPPMRFPRHSLPALVPS